MKKAVWSSVAAVVLLSWAAPAAAQQTATGTVNVTANVAARARLTLGAASITFNDADPDVTPSLTATAITIDVMARTGAASNVTLTVQSNGDLTTGSDTIPISNLTWTVGGDAGFQAGTAAAADVTLGSWTGGGARSGTQTYALVNSWDYAIGTYTATLTYTLTSP
jgi:hypothetical protein